MRKSVFLSCCCCKEGRWESLLVIMPHTHTKSIKKSQYLLISKSLPTGESHLCPALANSSVDRLCRINCTLILIAPKSVLCSKRRAKCSWLSSSYTSKGFMENCHKWEALNHRVPLIHNQTITIRPQNHKFGGMKASVWVFWRTAHMNTGCKCCEGATSSIRPYQGLVETQKRQHKPC